MNGGQLVTKAIPQLTRRERRRILVAALARSAAMTFAAFALYAAVPVDSITQTDVFIRLLICLTLFGVAITLQVRSILKSPRPQLRAFEMLFNAIVLLIVIFATLYLSMSSSDAGNFTLDLDRPSAVYFTTTVLATVGFGDITPVTTAARMVVTVQMVLNLFLLGGIVRVLFGAARMGVERRDLVEDSATDDGANFTHD